MLLLRLPGGCAITCTPASRISSPVMISFASPPPNSTGNSEPKCRLTLSKVSRSSSRVSRSMRRIASSSVVHRLLQVGRLRIEEALALAAARQLLERGQVHRAQLADRLRQARDLALQRRGARRALGLGGEASLVRAGLVQLHFVLVVVDLRRLLLQAQLVDALAQRRERASRSAGAPPPARAARQPRPPPSSRALGQRLLAGRCATSTAASSAPRTAGTGSTASSAVRLADFLFRALDLLVDHAHRIVDLGDLRRDTSRSPNTASCASRSACCPRTRCSASAVSAAT